MKTRTELLKSKGYWIAKIQTELFDQVLTYIKENKITRSQLAEQLGVSRGYVTQVLNGDYNHKISKLIELSLAIGKAPLIEYADIERYIEEDELGILDIPKHERPNINLEFAESRIGPPIKTDPAVYEITDGEMKKYNVNTKLVEQE